MLTATQRAEHMAQQVLIFARLHNSMVVTADLVDSVMSRDAGTEQGTADVGTVRRIIRKRAGAEGVRVILTETERYWAIREQLHHLHGDQVNDLADSIAAGGDDDPRGWDSQLIKALSVRRSRRIPPEHLWSCVPVSVRLWREPRPAEEKSLTAAEAQRLAANEVIAGRARTALAERQIGEAERGVAGVRFHVDAQAVLLYAVDYRGWSTPVLLEMFAKPLVEGGWTAEHGISVRGSYLRLLPPVEEVIDEAAPVDPYTALIRSLSAADLSEATYSVTASRDGVERDCPAQEGKRMPLAVGIKHGDGARVEGTAELFTVDWRGVSNGPGDTVFTYRRTTPVRPA